jgi:hypothetical protein
MAIQNSSALTAPGTSSLSLQVSSVDDLARLARVFAASGLFGRAGNQDTQIAECAIRLMAGMEAGFSPFASATGVHIINGRPASPCAGTLTTTTGSWRDRQDLPRPVPVSW